MKANVGTVDKVIRCTSAVAIGAGIGTGVVSGAIAWLLGGAAIALVVTSSISYCGLYSLLGVSTCPVERR